MALARTCIALTTAAVILVAGVAAPASAAATSTAGPVTAGLTITPSVTAVGGQVIVVATATNTSASPVAASLGLDDYQYADQVFTSVRGTPGCTPRNLHHLIYCGIQSLAPGATAGITLTLTAAAPGTDSFRTYARITYTTDDTFAYGTLTIR
ncbi:hypothetical protein ODJ79_37860 [Actinoplanes sp. KI2]|uniref:hypothetical protein n=1 Tax=Actinoplanes sp. KI2 TaxID=2983315 RepID=UPI0021D57416|nr:hypothetical protein [Actinoplanes sp. KI2]MCU7729516.1 hypothetical protein [Actinoplanes sp. KI2]